MADRDKKPSNHGYGMRAASIDKNSAASFQQLLGKFQDHAKAGKHLMGTPAVNQPKYVDYKAPAEPENPILKDKKERFLYSIRIPAKQEHQIPITKKKKPKKANFSLDDKESSSTNTNPKPRKSLQKPELPKKEEIKPKPLQSVIKPNEVKKEEVKKEEPKKEEPKKEEPKKEEPKTKPIQGIINNMNKNETKKEAPKVNKVIEQKKEITIPKHNPPSNTQAHKAKPNDISKDANNPFNSKGKSVADRLSMFNKSKKEEEAKPVIKSQPRRSLKSVKKEEISQPKIEKVEPKVEDKPNPINKEKVEPKAEDNPNPIIKEKVEPKVNKVEKYYKENEKVANESTEFAPKKRKFF